MTTIPNGTQVRFLRPEHSVEHYAAVVRNSHRLYGGEGHHYEIDCKEFPFIIGFAHDEELFTDVKLAEAASKVAKTADNERKRKKLLVEKTRIERTGRAFPN